jgi:uncharacterized protein YggE
MDSKPDTIKVSASHREEIFASHADLFVAVKGSSVVSGDQAMKKAKEVSLLVDELTRFGITSENIHLQGVRVESSSGVLLKSSSAIYRLRIRCEKLDQIPDLLDIVASQKNAALERIEWKYPSETAQERALEQAIVQAKRKAEKVAAALGIKLLGVYEFLEVTRDEEFPFEQAEMGMMQKARGVTPALQPSLDMDIQHSKTVKVIVEVEFRVSAF